MGTFCNFSRLLPCLDDDGKEEYRSLAWSWNLRPFLLRALPKDAISNYKNMLRKELKRELIRCITRTWGYFVMDHGDLLPYLEVSRIFLTPGLRVWEKWCTYFRIRTGLLDTCCNMCKILHPSPIFIAYATMLLKYGAQQGKAVNKNHNHHFRIPTSIFCLRLAGVCQFVVVLWWILLRWFHLDRFPNVFPPITRWHADDDDEDQRCMGEACNSRSRRC